MASIYSRTFKNVAVFFTMFFCLINATVHAGTIAELSALVEQWSKLEQTRANEQQSWLKHKKLLNARLKLLENEKNKLTKTQQKLAEKNSQQNKLLQAAQAKAAFAAKQLNAIADQLLTAENDFNALLSNLPEMFVQQLGQHPSFDRQSGDTTNHLLEMCRSYQKLLKAQNQIHTLKWILKGPDSRMREYDVMCLGSAAVFAHCPNTEFSGFAIPEKATKQWNWEWSKKYHHHIKNAVLASKNKTQTTLERLPFKAKEQTL